MPSPAGDSAPAFDVAKGERFAVILPSNRTTGFQWQLGRPLDGNVVKLVGSEYRTHENHVAGAAGSERWIFEAVAAGETTIVLHYVRPWEKSAPPARVGTFSVLVH